MAFENGTHKQISTIRRGSLPIGFVFSNNHKFWPQLKQVTIYNWKVTIGIMDDIYKPIRKGLPRDVFEQIHAAVTGEKIFERFKLVWQGF